MNWWSKSIIYIIYFSLNFILIIIIDWIRELDGVRLFRMYQGKLEIELVHETQDSTTPIFFSIGLAVNDFRRFGVRARARSGEAIVGFGYECFGNKRGGASKSMRNRAFLALGLWVRGVLARTAHRVVTEHRDSCSWSLGKLATERASCGAECISKFLSFILSLFFFLSFSLGRSFVLLQRDGI